jgi:hypothetical protein
MPYLSPELGQESEDIQRKRRIADALIGQGMRPAEGQMVGRFYVPGNTLNGAINAIGGTLLGKKLAGQEKGVVARGEAQQQDELARVTRALQGTQAQTIQPDPQEATQTADYGTPPVGPAQVQAQTPQQALEGILPSLRTPMGQHMGQAYLGGQVAQLGPDKPIVVGKSLVHPRTGQVMMTDPSVASESEAARAGREAEAGRQRDFARQQAEAARAGRPQEPLVSIIGPDGKAVLVSRADAVGKTPANVDKPLTEVQGKSALYGARMGTSDLTLQDLENEISTSGLAAKQAAGNLPIVGGALGAIGNTMLSPAQQRVEQAQRDFVNATLRQESGAAISPTEFDSAKKQYFPQPGDSKEVIDQKRRNRQIAIGGFRTMAGHGASEIDAAIAAHPRAQKNNGPQTRSGDGAPAGVDAAIWAAMTPQERALWRN